MFKKSLLKNYIRREIPIPYKIVLSRPIFIIGSSRSGTSMLARLLGSSPELCFFTENAIVRRHMWRMVEYPFLISNELPELKKTLVRLSGLTSRQRLLEKTPGHSLLAKSLAEYFSDAKFIHIIRDARNVASSMLKHQWIADELRGINSIFWFNLLPIEFQREWSQLSLWKRGILRWAVYVDSGRQIASYRNRYLEVKYEEMCQSPEKCTNNILNFLELNNFPELKYQLSDIKPNCASQWKKEGLNIEQIEFYHQVLSAFKHLKNQ